MKTTPKTEPQTAGAEPAGNNTQKAALRSMVRGSYDLQKLRIESGNRLVATFKAKLGHKPGTLFAMPR
jgi:hypothetical protein